MSEAGMENRQGDPEGGRPDGDTRCPTCGGSAHAHNATTAPAFGGREFSPQGARKALDQAWTREERTAAEIDDTYRHLRAVIENAKTQTVEAIRHQLVGLLPEVKGPSPELRAKLPQLAERRDAAVRETWTEYGYPTSEESAHD